MEKVIKLSQQEKYFQFLVTIKTEFFLYQVCTFLQKWVYGGFQFFGWIWNIIILFRIFCGIGRLGNKIYKKKDP